MTTRRKAPGLKIENTLMGSLMSRHKAKAVASITARLRPIASATSLEQLDELMGSARLTLTAEDLATLDKASAKDS